MTEFHFPLSGCLSRGAGWGTGPGEKQIGNGSMVGTAGVARNSLQESEHWALPGGEPSLGNHKELRLEQSHVKKMRMSGQALGFGVCLCLPRGTSSHGRNVQERGWEQLLVPGASWVPAPC